MIYRENDEYKLMPYLATYTQHGEVHEQYVVDKSELTAFEQMGHITGLKFKEATHNPESIERLEEVKNFPVDDYQVVADYVVENKVQEGSSLALKKQNETLEESMLELSMMFMGGL